MTQEKHRTIVLIMAAGKGTRLGGDLPKQYQDLEGRSILIQAIMPFINHSDIDAVRVVISENDEELYSKTIQAVDSPKLLSPVVGGKERSQSVLRGLKSLETLSPSRVLIHDGARPYITHEIISNVLEGLKHHKGVIPVIPVVDTLKKAPNNQICQTVSRVDLYRAQTPQGFDFQTIYKAHQDLQDDLSFTDDASLLESLNIPVFVVPGDSKNIKITTSEDKPEDKKGVHMSTPDIRVGHGIDVHAIGPGKGVTLLGVFIPVGFSLIGHSDADVGLHSLADALLGAIADKDIGHHFSPKDDRWKGMDSALILKEAARRVREQGGAISHVDITIMGERPKVSGYRDQMIRRVAEILGLEERRVSVKATTTEKLGFLGREEGLASFSTATIIF